jgi:hypothetical protein
MNMPHAQCVGRVNPEYDCIYSVSAISAISIFMSQIHCISGLLNNQQIIFWKLDLLVSLGEASETHTLLGPFERANLTHLRHSHLKIETNPVSKTLCFLLFRILDHEQSPEIHSF